MSEVEIKPLWWTDYAHPYMMSYAIVPALWIAYRVTLRSDGMKVLRVEQLENHNDDLGIFRDTEAAKAAAQADYEIRRSAVK